MELMNKVLLTGNITNIYDNSQNVKITIADNYKETSTYIGITYFAEHCKEFIRNYMRKGDHVEITGRIGTYKDNLGQERISIIGHEISFDGYRNPRTKQNEINNFVLLEEAEKTFNELKGLEEVAEQEHPFCAE